jgi:hypothetical protein
MTRSEPRVGASCAWTPTPTFISQSARFHEAFMDLVWAVFIEIAPPFEWVLSKLPRRNG